MEDNLGWSTAWLWMGVFVLVFVAAMYSEPNASIGAITVSLIGWVLYAMDWFASVNSVSIISGLTLATVVSIAAYMSDKAKKE